MLFTFAFALLLAQEAAQGLQPPAPATNATAKPAEKCSVEGKAVNAATGEPLKKAHVTLQGSNADNFNTSFSIITGPDGAFMLKDVDAGIYRLTANRTGFAPAAYGAKKLSTGGTQIHLTPGQAMKEIVLRLQPQSVVTGRITDSDGDPVANVSVSLVRSVWRNGQRTTVPSSGASTNDLGEYRIFGVAAGKYRMRAILRSNSSAAGDQEEYAPTYYPGQPDPAGAAVIDLQPGQTLRGIDMVVLPTPTRRVRGRIVLSAGGRPDFISVMVTGRDPGEMFDMRRATGVRPAKPEFQFRLAPGSYTVSAYYSDSGAIFSGVAQVDVGNADIDNVTVHLEPAAEVSGRIRIEGSNDVSALAQKNVRVQLFPKDFALFGAQPSRMSDDGTFTIKNVGPQAMNINVSGLPDGYYVKSATYGQQDAKNNGLNYTGSNDSIEVIVSPKGATVSGVVHNHAGDPIGGATVVLAPPADQRSNTRNFRVATTDQTGKFNIKGVEPNSYTVFAWEDIQPGEYMDPDVLKAAENRGKELKLDEGSQESLDIESIPAEDAPAAAGAF